MPQHHTDKVPKKCHVFFECCKAVKWKVVIEGRAEVCQSDYENFNSFVAFVKIDYFLFKLLTKTFQQNVAKFLFWL